MSAQVKNNSPVVVGIGASAGGLVVLQQLVSGLSEKPNMCYIIVQHLDPTHESMLAEILSKSSNLPVHVAEERQQLVPGHVYIIPPNAFLEVENLHIKLTKPKQVTGSRKAIDHLFRSMAKDLHHRCVAIILSGSGNDGTAGARVIKAAGGVTIAQNPASAKHASMPQCAIETGCIDQVLEIEQIPEVLASLKEQPFFQLSSEPASLKNLQEISAIIKTHEEFDLSQYKPSTVTRRILRRMRIMGIEKYGDYLNQLKTNEDERKQLTKDLLINITDFFRDSKAFSLLEKKILNKIICERGDDSDQIRIWVAGCASGEEAYSISILVHELMLSIGRKKEVRIFATDIDNQAIQIARKGEYPASIASEVPNEYLKKYFVKLETGYYRVNSTLRDSISFALQNVVENPPFSNMDLISCRNLLIYLQKDIQRKVFNAFHFSLKPDGYLFLGSAEAADSELFQPVFSKWKIFQKKEVSRKIKSNELDSVIKRRFNSYTKSSRPIQDQIQNRLLRSTLPGTIVIDERGTIKYNHGLVHPFVTVPEGEPKTILFDVLIPSLRAKVRSAVFKVNQTLQPTSFHFRLDGKDYYKAEIYLLEGEQSQSQLWGITFNPEKQADQPTEVKKDSNQESVHDTTIANLETELHETKQQLQTTIEELESHSEELKASHEETLSTNEELQSANEELEASSEELRSLNEELRTVNDQLKEKIFQIQEANDDLSNFFSSTNVPTIFLDRELNLIRYTPTAELLLNLNRSDIGRSVGSFRVSVVDANLIKESKKVLNSFQPVVLEKVSEENKYYQCQITPYKTEDRRIEGVVITFQDITDIKVLASRAQRREIQQSAVSKIGMLALSGLEFNQLLDQVCIEIATTLEVEFSKVLKYRPDQKDLLLVSGVGWNDNLVGSATVRDRKDSQAGYTLISTEPVIVVDLSNEKRFSRPQLLRDHQVVSAISCPINHSDPPFGVIAVHSKVKREFNDDDANFLMSIANLLSIIVKERDSKRKLKVSEAHFRTLSNAIPQLAWMADKDGALVWYNDRWYEYTGTSFEQMKGWGWQSVHHPEHVDRVTNKFKEHVENGMDWEDTFPLRNKQGEYRWFLSRASAVNDAEGRITNWFGTNTDITDQLEAERALKESEAKLRIAKDSGKVGAFDYHFQDDVVIIDSFLQNLWGVDHPTLSHKQFWESIEPKDRENVKKRMNQLVKNDEKGHFEAEFQVHNALSGNSYHVDASGQVIYDKDIPVKLLGMIIDISERKILEQELTKAVRRLEDINEKKNTFLATLGHELRNPLASISGGTQLIAMEYPDLEELPILEKGVNHMSALLDDLLDLARIERGKLKINHTLVHLSEVVTNICRSHKNLAGDRNFFYKLPSQSLYILGDHTRLEQILANVLSNALKFTKTGDSISLTLEEKNQSILIKIQDTGRGFKKENAEVIFNPFEQLSTEGHNKGLGIGLSLVKQLVELHHGTIEAKSDGIGKGATFMITFPLTSKPEISKKIPVVSPKSEKNNLLAMIVDDNKDAAAGLATLLNRKYKIKTVVYHSGQDALENLSDDNFDMYILDIGLPDIDGYQLIKKIKQVNSSDSLFIAYSGYGHQEAVNKSMNAGFNYHLNKPIKLEELEKILETFPSDS